MNTRQLIQEAMLRAIRADGHTPVRAVLDAAGRCTICGEEEKRCPGWHAAERAQGEADQER